MGELVHGDAPSSLQIATLVAMVVQQHILLGFFLAAGPDATLQDIQDHLDPAGTAEGGPPEQLLGLRPFPSVATATATLDAGLVVTLITKYRRNTI